MSLLQLAKSELLRANADRKHPFRNFWLGTFGAYPEVRTVVKRKIYEDLTTLFFTDSRSPKIQQIRENDKVTALFYHARKKLQVRIKGHALISDPEGDEYRELLQRIWQSAAMKDYTSLFAPGSEQTDEAEALFGEEVNFAAVKIVPVELDILQLGTQAHTRMRYTREGEAWLEQKLVP